MAVARSIVEAELRHLKNAMQELGLANARIAELEKENAARKLTQGDVRKIVNSVMDLWHPQGKCESVLDDCGPCIFCWGETELEGDKNEEDQVQMVRCIVDLVIAAVRP